MSESPTPATRNSPRSALTNSSAGVDGNTCVRGIIGWKRQPSVNRSPVISATASTANAGADRRPRARSAISAVTIRPRATAAALQASVQPRRPFALRKERAHARNGTMPAIISATVATAGQTATLDAPPSRVTVSRAGVSLVRASTPNAASTIEDAITTTPKRLSTTTPAPGTSMNRSTKPGAPYMSAAATRTLPARNRTRQAPRAATTPTAASTQTATPG